MARFGEFPKPTLSIYEAAKRARLRGLLTGGNFYDLETWQESELRALRAKTKWKRTPAQLALGWTDIVAFYSALKKKKGLEPLDRQREIALKQEAFGTELRARATKLHGDKLKAKIVLLQRASDAYVIALDLFEELDDHKKYREITERLDHTQRSLEDARQRYHRGVLSRNMSRDHNADVGPVKRKR